MTKQSSGQKISNLPARLPFQILLPSPSDTYFTVYKERARSLSRPADMMFAI